jgi:hypothetical protein
MSHTLTEVDAFTASVTVPDPGDPIVANDVVVCCQSLANRTKHLYEGNAVFTGDKTFQGSLTCNDTVTFEDAVHFNDPVDVNATFDVVGNATIDGLFQVNGSANFTSGISRSISSISASAAPSVPSVEIIEVSGQAANATVTLDGDAGLAGNIVYIVRRDTPAYTLAVNSEATQQALLGTGDAGWIVMYRRNAGDPASNWKPLQWSADWTI